MAGNQVANGCQRGRRPSLARRFRGAAYRPLVALLGGAVFCVPTRAAQLPPVEPRPDTWGAGVILGEPTGLSAIWQRSDSHALATALAWSLPDDHLHVHADYLYTLTRFRDPELQEVAFPVSMGVGARVRTGGDEGWGDDFGVSLGVRVPFNLSMMPDRVPLDVFLELVPVVGLLPATDLDLDAAVGIRFYFR